MTEDANTGSSPSSADPAEIAKFSALADTWWALEGPFKPLHKFNPVRIGLLKDRLARHFGRDATQERPFEGLSLLDIGCGGGLIAEPMARLGFAVTGIDASAKNVGTARAHAERMRLKIDYRAVKPEELGDDERFDVVLALEVVEHVPDRALFLKAAARPLKSGGFVGLATLNRTMKSLVMAKIGAEYVVRWLPVGTHDWREFVKPSELARDCRAAGLGEPAFTGLTYNPLKDSWRESDDLSVNYMAFAAKA
ncbi:3-demethylubiquinone-9 3-methyltransferase [uncultured Alphaproteobacteria bacterium]|uniref:Ubiquinone biosynthesis O-methyltransferase n=1 Tax=uncultured Alphaproteobacteria bacterium TaxID=91750 RepID=A0A212IY26_9PROT|nr:3-demethylubiquinone-9 3-methyltransferase [uncultured Alphaproteobacteria bacterium]